MEERRRRRRGSIMKVESRMGQTLETGLTPLMSGPCSLKDKDRCVCVQVAYFHMPAVACSEEQTRFLSTDMPPRCNVCLPTNKAHSGSVDQSAHRDVLGFRCWRFASRLSDMKMLDAATRFPPVTPCYSGPVCAINSNPDVCHPPHPPSPSSIFSAPSLHPCSAASKTTRMMMMMMKEE